MDYCIEWGAGFVAFCFKEKKDRVIFHAKAQRNAKNTGSLRLSESLRLCVNHKNHFFFQQPRITFAVPEWQKNN
jgi:hypothetical protein